MVVYETMTSSSAAVMRLLKRRVARSLVGDGNGVKAVAADTSARETSFSASAGRTSNLRQGEGGASQRGLG